MAHDQEEVSDTDIAVVGMAGRFPGARDVDTLWARVRDGDDCLDELDATEVIRVGVSPSLVRSGDYVLRDGRIEDVEAFDHEFFGFSERDGSVMDPQHRHFMECAWEALESAAVDPERFDGSIGVFGGSGMNTYLLHNLLTNPDLVERLGWFLLRHTSNDKDFLTTTTSYKLGLDGPSVNVQTACSTSLVAVHLGVQSLLSFECDLALAGGVTIEFPHGTGHEYREGEILSPSGYCRAFDASSEGTVLTSGAAVVALRRLSDAIEDGDPILAVVKGSAINNDGDRKVGYLAPSVDGHADVVREALAIADVDARTIGLLEAHGTGTAIGDPIEVAALTEAFRGQTDDTGFCRLTSTKPNIGHLDTAAGTASLIKAIQALRHQTLPPLANHTGPAPLLDIERTPFTLSGTATPWESSSPRRAGVSSLGVGGTNAHVVLQEAPAQPATDSAPSHQVLTISANSQDALDDATEQLAAYFEANPEANPADVAHTLLEGRQAMARRRVVVVTGAASAPDELRSTDRRRRPTGQAGETTRSVVFTFPGGGSQYPGMGAGLDDRFDVFHQVRSEGVELAKRLADLDLAPSFEPDADATVLRRASVSLPAVFITSVALARQWMAWGVEPDAMIGHSLGEYVAAHLAGVMSFEDALQLVLVRSRLMEDVSGDDAAMLVIPLPEVEVLAELDQALSLATVNAEDECVVAGPSAAIDDYADRLAGRDVDANRIPLAAAAHSSMLDPVLDDFLAAVSAVELKAPERPYVSNLTGQWITAEQATSARYWVDHLRNTVRFADGLQTVLGEQDAVVVELGPGHALSSYARRSGLTAATISSLRHPDDDVDDTTNTIGAFAQLWMHGAEVDLAQFHGGDRRKLRLPTYPFRRTRCWVEPGRGSALLPAGSDDDLGLVRLEELDEMGWRPSWLPAGPDRSQTPAVDAWLVIGDTGADGVTTELERRGRTVKRLPTTATADEIEETIDDTSGVVLVSSGPADQEASFRRWLSVAPTAIRNLSAKTENTRFVAVTEGALAVDGPAARPVDAAALGCVLVAPNEYEDLDAALVDVDRLDSSTIEAVADEIDGATGVIAWRDGQRLRPGRVAVEDIGESGVGFRSGGTYLITGGLGDIGAEIATYLAEQHDINLVLTSTEPLPAGPDRDRFLAANAYDHPTCRRIRQIQRIEQTGVKVTVVAADLASADALRAALDEAERVVGRLDGAIHAAGRLRDRLLEMAEADDLRFVTDPKAGAALVLAAELERRGAELLVLISSTSTELAPEGQTGYVAANAVLDAMAGRPGDLRVATLNFGVWAGQGMAAEAGRRLRLGLVADDPVEHPVLGEIGTDQRGRILVSGRLNAGHHWVVADHRTGDGVAILPGTGHIELYLAAIEAAGLAPAAITDVTLLEPLVVPDDTAVTVQVVIEGDEQSGRSIRLDGDGGTGSSWTTHSEATLATSSAPGGTLDLPELERRCQLDGRNPLESAGAHLRLGPRWQPETSAGRGDGEAFGRITMPDELGASWRFDPALLDAATGFAVLVAQDGEGRLHVPVGYDRIDWYASPGREAVVHANLLSGSTEDMVRADLSVADETGRVALRIGGLQLRPLTTSAALAPVTPISPADATAPAGLLDLADEFGLRADEGLAWLERLASGDLDRVIVSSVDLDDLKLELAADEPDQAADGASEPDQAASGASLEDRLTAMWSDLLGVDRIGADDDFFDLGGHSLIAIRLMTRIKKELGIRLQLAALFEAPTIDSLAELIRRQAPDLDQQQGAADVAGESKQLVSINPSGTKRPLYIVHGAGGNVLFLWTLSRAIGRDQPIHGFQAHGINEGEIPDTSIEAMAERYVNELRQHSSGPYLLGGYSGGGVVTLEMVRQLQALGETVDHVLLFDSVPTGELDPPTVTQWRNIGRHIADKGLRPLVPHLRIRTLASLRRYIPEQRDRVEEHETQDRALGYRDVADQGFVNLFYYFTATAERYQMTTYDVDVTILKAAHVWPSQPEDYHWSAFIGGTIDQVVVPGDHHTMFYPEHASILADTVRQVLVRFETEPADGDGDDGARPTG